MKAKYILITLLALVVTACSNVVETDDDYVSGHNQPNTGAPVIRAVYAVTDGDLLTPLTEAAPGQRIAIVGDNLNNLRQLTFNTVAADLSETYTTLTKAVVKIPDTYSKAHENVISYTTDMGTATFRFAVALPVAEIYGLLNEFCASGSEASVAGKNLQYYDFTLTLNGQSVAFTTVTDTQLSFQIPQQTPDNSVFVLTWQTPQGETKTVELPFRPTNELLFSDLTQTTRQQTDENVDIETTAEGTTCLHFLGTITEWSWVELSFAQPFADGVLPAADSDDYYFVFEVQTATGHPLLDTGYEFAWNWDWNNSYRWNPGEGVDTKGQWQTVRCPLDEMAPRGLTADNDILTLNVGFQPYKDYEADFRLANFRIEKK